MIVYFHESVASSRMSFFDLIADNKFRGVLLTILNFHEFHKTCMICEKLICARSVDLRYQIGIGHAFCPTTVSYQNGFSASLSNMCRYYVHVSVKAISVKAIDVTFKLQSSPKLKMRVGNSVWRYLGISS